jgi:uncharacterized cofD-like protein
VAREPRLHPDQPLRVVTLGGGTGMAALLRALKREGVRPKDPWSLTAIVTVSDDGGSSGRLRTEMGGIPPGDIRNCLSALAREESLLTEMMNYRFKGTGTLAGHSLGNLMLFALADLTGNWVRAIRQLGSVIVTAGRLYPSTLQPVTLCAEDLQGRLYRGETNVNESHPPLARLWLEPQDAEPLPEALLAILRADVIILSPGSLYTSTIPNLLIPEIRESIAAAKAPVLYVANLMTEPGESQGMTLVDHVASIQAFGEVPLSAVLANGTPFPGPLLSRYLDEGAEPVIPTLGQDLGVPVHALPLLDPESPVARHHPDLLNQAVREVIQML